MNPLGVAVPEAMASPAARGQAPDDGTIATPTGRRFAHLAPTIVDAVRATVARIPDAEAVVDLGSGQRLSYARLLEEASVVAGGLAELGIAPGERVVVALPNGADWTRAFLGALLAGAVPVPINPRLTSAEHDFIVNDSGALMVIDTELPAGRPILTPATDPESTAALFYTSGTTGRPKGVMLSHRAMLSAAEQVRIRYGLGPHDTLRTLVAAPLFHVLALGMQWVPALVSGGCAVVMPGFEVGAWLAAVRDEEIDILNGVPAMFWHALRHEDFASIDTSRVRILSYGAAPTPPAQAVALREAFPGARLAPGYGLTEAPCVTGLEDADAIEHCGSVGTALPGTELRLLGPEAEDGIGQLLVRGPQVMSGYWRRPGATDAALVDGWLHTGDIVRVDAHGRVQILDRRTDLINRGGENVYSVEVEAALAAHPSVAEVAVVGLPDERLGQRVGAAVVLRAGTDLDPISLRALARQSLAPFKVPELLSVRREPLPRNAAGKVDKHAVRSGNGWTELGPS